MISPLNAPNSNPWLAHPVRIHAITAEIADVATYHLEFVDPEQQAVYSCRPGQFNMLYLPGVGEAPISVSGQGLVGDTWAHTVRVVGNTTRALERLGVGGGTGSVVADAAVAGRRPDAVAEPLAGGAAVAPG